MYVPKTRYISRATCFPFLYKLNAALVPRYDRAHVDNRSVSRLTCELRIRCEFLKEMNYISCRLSLNLADLANVTTATTRVREGEKEDRKKKRYLLHYRFRRKSSIISRKIRSTKEYFRLSNAKLLTQEGAQKCQREGAPACGMRSRIFGASELARFIYPREHAI